MMACCRLLYLTMYSGTAQQPGIIFLTMQELFERIGDIQEDKVTEITLSYLEIYNETIRDLLVPPGTSGKQGLMLREDANQAVSVAGLSSHRPQNVRLTWRARPMTRADKNSGPRSHGHAHPGQCRTHAISNRGQCNIISISRCTADQRLPKESQRIHFRAYHNGHPLHN